MTENTPPAGWYADPSGRYEHRYWDGSTWTEHVTTNGQAAVDAFSAPGQNQVNLRTTPEQVQRQVAKAGAAAQASGTGSLFDEPVLVVNQKAKLIELTNEYAVFDQHGTQLGSVVEVGQSVFRKVLRAVSKLDQFLTHRFEVRDARGTVVLRVTRPGTIWKSRVVVAAPDGSELGQIKQENLIGKIRFGFLANGQRIGGINAENWRAWNFRITDAQDREVARITKTWEGLGKALFTTADKYVVQVHERLPDPLRALVVASALTVDTVLKQDNG